MTKPIRPLTNLEVAEILRDMAAAYEIINGDKYKFQVVAYERAADGIEKLSSSVKDYSDEGKLREISGVGKSISEHLDELIKKGKSTHFDEMLLKFPPAVFVLMKVPGIGPKKAFRLATELKLGKENVLTQLLSAAKKGEIAKLTGFGEESEKDIVQAVLEYREKPPERVLLSTATEVSESVIDWLKTSKAVLSIDTLGSLRRKASTVGDVDISVASNDSEAVFDRLASYPNLVRVIERGERSCSILITGNVQVDVMVQPPEAYGSLLQHFTGSKHHNIALREFALKKGLSLSEYGIKIKGKLQQYKDEKSFYEALGLSYIPPELRENRGEIQIAEKGEIPKLLELADIKGDLQIHSDFDIETSHDVGESSMRKIAEKALQLGYEYIAFTEHNPSQKGHTLRTTLELLKKKREEIVKLNSLLVKADVKNRLSTKRPTNFKVFNSLEVDILPTGGLAIGENALEVLDFALVSIHSSFKQDTKIITKRVLEALAFPNVKIFAHPTARILNKREGINLEWEAIFDFALKNNKWIEINADPHRLDLPDELVSDAVKLGVKLTLGTDSHHVDGLNNMKYGVNVARRGWATGHDIINTRSLEEFEKLLRR